MSCRQRPAMMTNDNDIDNWKTGFNSNEFVRKRFGLVDHVDSDEDMTLTRVKHSSSGSEIRYINPAIYTESINEEESESDREQEDATLPLELSTTRSTISSGRNTRMERRCKIDSISVDQNKVNIDQNETTKHDKYDVLDGRQIVRISTTSLSVESSISNHHQISDLDRRIAHSEWMRKKHEAAQRTREKEELALKKRQEEEEREAQKKEERARLERENFLKWIERKRQQELDRRAMLENELELQRRLKEIEDNLAGAKTTYLRRWFHKKKEEQTAQRKQQEMRQKKMDEERERRLEQSTKAYEKWRENSKNKPKPATQGLLPHQKAKPAYINPIPWQSIVEIDPDETQEDTLHEKKRNINQLKINDKKTIIAHQ
ncbi:PREDICTED: coiled-coil domain-containing protein 34-like isoform X2 [Trachymyrmex septentrionalis]|uniref:coiled-coil domain-containing protein 34-like isoform X2 n=1 Tax=Trachymyrmex septentrionalis TaxID=34720 RepID=UPI00084F2F5D|nr:PREDICTED: coiled-coil domain-containing protein 34-like isoform X2 [Trachymyrmex septentrionalis]